MIELAEKYRTIGFPDRKANELLEIVSDPTARDEINQLIKFSNLILKISTSLINIPLHEIDNGIDNLLRDISEFIGIDKSYIFIFDEESQTITNTHEWCREGIESRKSLFLNIPSLAYPWAINQFRNNKLILFSDIETLPSDAYSEKKLFIEHNIKSMLNLPLVRKGKVIGFTGFDSIRQPKYWNENSIHLLRILSEIIVNILDRKGYDEALQESEQRFKSLIGNTPIPIILYSGNTCLFANSEAARTLGLDSENDIINKSIYEIIHPNYYNIFRESAYKFYDKISQLESIEARMIKPDGREIEVEVILSHINYLNKSANQLVFRDITVRKHDEEKFIDQNEALDFRVKERTAQLETALSDLTKEIEQRKQVETELINAKIEISQSLNREKELSDIKSSFINMISHEYRTPLSVILSSADLVERYVENFDDSAIDRINSHLEKIKQAVKNLTGLLEKVLTVKEDMDGRLEFKAISFNLLDIINELIENIRLVDNNQHLIEVVAVEDELKLFTDPRLLRQSLSNILVNARKYSPKNSLITIRIEENGLFYDIYITDRGYGISKEDLPHIFEPFYKSKADIGIKPGTGLGLSISKRFIEIIGGIISVQSVFGEGTTFIVSIPKSGAGE